MPDEISFEKAECELFGDLNEDDNHHGHGHRSPEGPLVSCDPHESEKLNVQKLKPTLKSKKNHELNAQFFDDDERDAFSSLMRTSGSSI